VTVIRVKDVHYRYGADTWALRGVSLEFGGGLAAIIGQNGAGKTTFARLLNGLLKPTSGEVWVDELNTAEHSVAEMARRVGLVFQNPNDQIFKSRILDEVMFGPRNLGVPEETARRRALAALELVGLAAVSDRNPYDFGLADRKLVGIASVLAMDTPVVVFDEPTIAQDHRGVEKIKAIIRGLGEQGKLVITITHDMDFVAEVFDRTIVFSRGTVALDAPTREVFSRPDLLREAFVEEPHVTRLGRAVFGPTVGPTDPRRAATADRDVPAAPTARTVLTVDEFVADYLTKVETRDARQKMG